MNKTIEKTALIEALQAQKPRSAWDKGVQQYAIDILEYIESVNTFELGKWQQVHEAILNGASTWRQYSYGGCALIYNGDIAERLCTKAELKQCDNGSKEPNEGNWLDVQTRALEQASDLIREAYKAAGV